MDNENKKNKIDNTKLNTEKKEKSNKIKEKDFIEISYEVYLKKTNTLIDTTDPEKARQINKAYIDGNIRSNVIFVRKKSNMPLLQAISRKIIDKELNKTYSFDLSAKDGFGEYNKNLVMTFKEKDFKNYKIKPQYGLSVVLNGMRGIIKSVNSGRVVIDFNNELAGKDLFVKVTPLNKLTNPKEILIKYISQQFGIADFVDINIVDKIAYVSPKQKINNESLKNIISRINNDSEFMNALNLEEIKIKE